MTSGLLPSIDSLNRLMLVDNIVSNCLRFSLSFRGGLRVGLPKWSFSDSGDRAWAGENMARFPDFPYPLIRVAADNQ